jgi:hypothetical protein
MKRKLTLRDLGAEKCINLLNPMKCECGCGGYANLIIDDKKDYNVFTVATSLLEETDCNNAWIFIIEDWAISGAYTSDKGIKYFSTAIPENKEPITDFNEQVELVKSIIEEAQPHCIGVLQHTKNGGFRVVADRVYDR